MYWAHNSEINYYKHHQETLSGDLPCELLSKKDVKYQNVMKKQIVDFVCKKINVKFFQKVFKYNLRFIFSSDYQVLNGLSFGTDSMNNSRIYKDLDLNNNTFVKTKPIVEDLGGIEDNLGFKLSEDFILCQSGARQVIIRSKDKIDSGRILNDLAKRCRVVLLNFDTGRNLDSKSTFEKNFGCIIYDCQSFKEQSVLIANAKNSVLFTEGDFRSHNYLPPFIGRNVYSISSKTTFDLGSAPIDFWNKNVFKFGGRVIPITYESLNAPQRYEEILEEICDN